MFPSPALTPPAGARNLRLGSQGYWGSGDGSSYPKEGNSHGSSVGDSSFRFAHRNPVIAETVKQFSPARSWASGGENRFVARAAPARVPDDTGRTGPLKGRERLPPGAELGRLGDRQGRWHSHRGGRQNWAVQGAGTRSERWSASETSAREGAPERVGAPNGPAVPVAVVERRRLRRALSSVRPAHPRRSGSRVRVRGRVPDVLLPVPAAAGAAVPVPAVPSQAEPAAHERHGPARARGPRWAGRQSAGASPHTRTEMRVTAPHHTIRQKLSGRRA